MLVTKSHVFHAYWEDFDQWDGNHFYDTLSLAKEMAGKDYVAYEYPDPDDFDDDDYEKPGALTWAPIGKFYWQLYDNEHYTGVWIFQGPVKGRP